MLVAALWTSGAAASPALRLGFGVPTAAVPQRTYEPRDTAGVGLFMDLDTLTARLEGVEFYIAYDCTTDAACQVSRSVDVVNFEPDRSLIGNVSQLLCDEECACSKCQSRSHYYLHIRTDRLSTVPRLARLGTLHVRTSRPARTAELRLPLARLWVFLDARPAVRGIDVAPASTSARFGGVMPDGQTRWGALKRIYR